MNESCVIKGGTIIDGSGSPGVVADIRIAGGSITAIDDLIPAQPGDETINATDMFVCPGLIDLHVHCFAGTGTFSLDPDRIGLRSGVTTMLDTGSAGSLNYPTFDRFVMPAFDEDVYALLNIAQLGALGHPAIQPPVGELTEPRLINEDAAVACIEQYPDRLIGMKVRLTAALADDDAAMEHMAFDAALNAAKRTDRLLMIHHVASNIPTADALGALRSGDVYTHCYHGAGDGAFDPKPSDAVRDARQRGVVIDVGHGMGAFAWRIAEPACQQHDFWPDVISTDVHVFNIDGPVFDMPTTLSKFLHLGMPLERVIEAATSAPARVMGLSKHMGRLAVGMRADVAILKLERGKFELIDAEGQIRIADHKLQAARTFKRGRAYAS
jgi:dihydroorotase